MAFLEKVKNQPEDVRKKIFWSIVILIGLGLSIWWAKNFQQRLKNFPVKELKIPSLEEKLKELPKMEWSKISEKEWEKIKAELNEEEIKVLEGILKVEIK